MSLSVLAISYSRNFPFLQSWLKNLEKQKKVREKKSLFSINRIPEKRVES
jgi:hypothetical protein